MKRLHLIVGIASLVAIVGCSTTRVEETALETDKTVSHTTQSHASLKQQIEPFDEGIKQATLGTKLALSARSRVAWLAVASRWEGAIDWMRKVPATTPQYAVARQKIRDYERHLTYARQQAQKQLKQEAKETQAGQEKLMRKVAKQYGYRPKIVVWNTQKVLALPETAWSRLTESQMSLMMDYAESQNATAIVTGKVKNSQTLEIEKKVLTLPNVER